MHARTRLQIMVMTVTRYPNFWPVKLTLEVRKIFVLMNPNRKELQVFCFLPIISILVKGTSAESSHPTVAAPPHIQLLAVGSKSRNNIVTHAVKCYTLALSYTLSQTYIYTLSHAITLKELTKLTPYNTCRVGSASFYNCRSRLKCHRILH